MELHQYIIAKAKEAGICQEWGDRIAAGMDAHQLLQLYKDGIDFCLAKDFPSNADLVRLGGDLLAEYGIYVDSNTVPSNDFTVLLGNSIADLLFDQFNTAQVFVKHTSRATIAAYDGAFVIVDVFDNAHVQITAADDSKVMVNIYGNAQVTADQSGNAYIKQVIKNKSTY